MRNKKQNNGDIIHLQYSFHLFIILKNYFDIFFFRFKHYLTFVKLETHFEREKFKK